MVTGFRKPMLCEKMSIEDAHTLPDVWVIEPKYDGVRAMIVDGKLYDRRGQEITARFPEFVDLGRAFDKNIVLDGEIIGKDFNEVGGRMHLRDKLQINLLSRKSPCRLVVFDCPSLIGTQEQRREYLRSLTMPEWAFVTPQYPMTLIGKIWGEVLRDGEEGLVIKHKHSFYEWGVRSPRWLKVKSFQETTAEFVKYEVHPKGVTIETADGRRVVVNGKQADEVIKTFKDNGTFHADIQYLPQRESDAWRFPSYRGIAVEQKVK